MRVCVYGAGAIGGHLAVRLALGGAEVSVLARGAHLAAIQHDGLTVHTTEGQLHARVRASDDPSALGPQDAVLVTVKAPALPAVAAGIGKLLKPDTPVAFVMNGIPWFYFHGIGGALEGRRLPKIDPDDALWRAVGPERAIAGVVYAASAVIAPGVIELENPNSRVVLGEPDGRESQRVQAIAAHINGGGMQAIVSTAIRDEIWNKLLGNLGNGPLCVLTQVSMSRLFEEPLCAEAALRVMQEAQAVANAVGAHPSANHEKRIAHSRGIDHKPSILQDLELGRPMEIDGIFDAPLELARMVGVATPMLDLLVAMAKVRARAAGLY
ncbi:MAG TPA: 2-dehydropantoate 2-reductase [Acetobacteraceae bacterium]|jgi:2-dehydropantoate 2-reductase